LEFADLELILENSKERFMKSKQLALQEQRSSVHKMSTSKMTAISKSLMPKRIMSNKTNNATAQPQEIPEKAQKEQVKKVPKDRSALIGIKRTRKSKD
jgi:hypothetical protein